MSVAWVGAAIAAVGVVSSSKTASKAGRIAQSQGDTQAMLAMEQLDAQVKQADELLAFNREIYNDGKLRQAGVDAINRKVIDQGLRVAEDNERRAAESYEFYQTKGRPVVEQALQDARGFDSQENIDAARGRATADVNQAFTSSQQAATRALTRMGINPNSSKFLALQQKLQLDKTAMLAGAANTAERNQRVGAIGLRQQASNIAQGFPTQAAGQNGVGLNAGGMALNGGNNSVNQNLALTGQALSGMSTGAGIYGQAAAGFNNLANTSANMFSTITRAGSDAQAGWGSLAGTGLGMLSRGGGNNIQAGFSNTGVGSSGFGSGLAYGNRDLGENFADGGKIKGPGTGTSDDVPAVNQDTGQRINLSNGEYVLSADTVKAVGTKFLDNLQAKHHKPVNLGRAA